MIDYLSLDCEGNEAAVMQSFPWDKHTISVLAVEHAPHSLRANLSAHGYQHLCNVGNVDTIWIHWDTMKTIMGRLVPDFKPTSTRVADARPHCSSILFDEAGECAKAQRIHRKTRYRITGKQDFA